MLRKYGLHKLITKVLLLKQLYLRELIGEQYCQLINYEKNNEILFANKSLNEIINNCVLCDLHKICKNRTYGILEKDSKISFITLRPIIPHTNGFKLIKNVANNVFKVDKYSLLSVIKCNTYNDITYDYILACKGYLHKQLSTINPKLIVLFGIETFKAILNINSDLQSIRGRILNDKTIKSSFITTYSINELLMNKTLKKMALEDFLHSIKIIGDFN